jgi:hypothetical protein
MKQATRKLPGWAALAPLVLLSCVERTAPNTAATQRALEGGSGFNKLATSCDKDPSFLLGCSLGYGSMAGGPCEALISTCNIQLEQLRQTAAAQCMGLPGGTMPLGSRTISVGELIYGAGSTAATCLFDGRSFSYSVSQVLTCAC